MNGNITSIRGEKRRFYEREDIELEVYHTSGEMGANFWVKEEDCFESRQSLVNSIVGSGEIKE